MSQLDQPGGVLSSIQNLPGWDKFLTIWGSISATLSFTHFSSIVGVILSLCTIAMIVPRALLNWDEWQEKREAEKLEKQRDQWPDIDDV